MNTRSQSQYLFSNFSNDLLKRINMPFMQQALMEENPWVPNVDIQEEPERFVVLVDVPGVDPKAISITMENNVLTVKGERKSESHDESKNFTRMERAYGAFYRQFTLPKSADSSNISAKSKHGVLEISIPKRQEANQQIAIQVEE